MATWRSSLRNLNKIMQRNEFYHDLIYFIDSEILNIGNGGGNFKMPELFNVIIDRMTILFNTEYIQVITTAQKKLFIEVSTQKEQIGDVIDYNNYVFSYLTKTDKSCNCVDIDSDLIIKDKYERISKPSKDKIKSFIAVPIQIMGSIVGFINVEGVNTHYFDEESVNLLEGIAKQLAVAIIQADYTYSIDFFSKLRKDITCIEPGRKSQMMDNVGEEIKRSFGVTFVQILIYNSINNELRVIYNNGSPELDTIVSVKKSISGYAIEKRSTYYSGKVDVKEDPRYVKMVGSGVESELVIPISIGKIAEEDDILGVINLEHEERDAFDPYLISKLQRFSHQIAPYFLSIKLKDELEQTRKVHRARDMLLSVTDISANLVHRLKNIVGSIKANVKDAKRYLEKPISETVINEVKSMLNDIEDAAKDALKIPGEMRERLTDKSPKNVSVVLKKLIMNFKNNPKYQMIEFKDIEIKDSDLPKVNCPSLDYVFENVIKNSLEAMMKSENDFKLLKIKIQKQEYSKAINAFVLVIISDNGVGISREKLSKIFKMGYSDKGKKCEGRSTGLGFGLAWTKAFVDSIGGEIIAKSEIGTGTDFIIKLPAYKEGELS